MEKKIKKEKVCPKDKSLKKHHSEVLLLFKALQWVHAHASPRGDRLL